MNRAMSRQHESLMDVLAPPVNPWLSDLIKDKLTALPRGVRVVRHFDLSHGDEGEAEPPPPRRRIRELQEA